MPRTSQAALAAVEIVGNRVEVVRRVRPPVELTEEQRVEFERVVGGMPAEWFSVGNVALLTQYCRHVVTARRVAEQVEAAILDGNADQLDKLFRAQAVESRTIAKLMTSLRMTPQAVEPRNTSKKHLNKTDSPWSGFGKARA